MNGQTDKQTNAAVGQPQPTLSGVKCIKTQLTATNPPLLLVVAFSRVFSSIYLELWIVVGIS